ncbi:uncharacterized protein EV420DRAFT_1673672 [Desarmillaria tabescens]|uniref:CCHC-type domain-containing protein n=1 Tax=Armillaria tabescens TaxID=1929756 RepID=A0AA39J6C3_ARMTA|nr:uncharacterized protein EV420DRAFT_1673672 [Desarmillaria tabescens]KAK0436076.1 hypothetical protein EV420DRAFT_1673672 [Desarmillaria tabescens]
MGSRSSVSRASSQTIVDPIEERNKALISKIKGEYDSDADDEDNVPPTPRKGRYVPPHRRPPSRHPKVEKDEPPLQFGDSRPRDQPTRPEASNRPNTRIPGEEPRPRPSQAPPQPRTRVGAAAPNPDPGDDGSSSDSQDSTPDPPNLPPNGPNPPNRHPDPPTPPRQRPNRPERGATPLVPSPRPQAVPVNTQSNHYDLREPASYFDSVLAHNQPRRPQQALDLTSHREQNPAPPPRTAPHSENHASPINVDSPTSSRNLGAGHPPNDPPPPPPPGGPGSHRSSSSSQHLSRSDNPQAREPTPAHFQEVRFTSQEPRFNNEEIFEYLPVMRSEVEIMLAIFQRYECLVNRNLLRVQRGLDSNVQKTSLQSIPHPQKYEGSSDLIEFDEWIFSIIRWMKIANICGPVYTEDEWGGQQLSAIDMQRTSTLATFLGGDAHTWYNNVVEDTPIAYTNNANGDDFPTFMEVINGLYRRFIHESSLYAVNEHFERVQYTFEGGVCQLFEVTRMGLTAEVSTVNDIMQHALTVEKGIRAERYYSQQWQDHISRLRKSSKENAISAKKRHSPSPRKFKKVQDKGKSNPNSKIPTCYGCGKKGHYSNDPSCPEYGKRSSGEKLYHIVDDNSPDNSSVNSASDHESSDEEYHTEVENPPDWTNLSEDEPGNSSGHQSPNNSDAEDPYGGSQYTSDEGTTDERMGFIFEEDNDYSDSSGISHFSEHLNDHTMDHDASSEDSSSISDSDSDGMESHDEYVLDFPEYLRAIQTEQTSDGKIKGYRPTLEPTKIHAPRTASRPKRTAAENRCLAALVTINGCEAFTLFDSGSTADAISPDFARLAKLNIFQLTKPITLQLGTKGSCSQISHGCNASYKFGNAHAFISGDNYYFDIANVDRYDAVLGTVFM